MSVTRRLTTGSFAVALAFLLIAGTAMAQQEQERQQQQQQQGQRNIVDTLRENPNFSQFYQLIRGTEVEELLTQRGPFTVFAPTNEALQQVQQNQLNQLKQNKEQLQTVLQRHIVRGQMTAAELARQESVNPLQGGPLQVRAMGQQAQARQGREREQAQARQQQNQQRERERETPVRAGQRLTQIAPDDQILITLIPKSDPSNVKSMQITGEQLRQMSEQLVSRLQQARSLQSEEVDVSDAGQDVQLMIGAANVVEPNIQASNGIIHGINKLLNQQN